MSSFVVITAAMSAYYVPPVRNDDILDTLQYLLYTWFLNALKGVSPFWGTEADKNLV